MQKELCPALDVTATGKEVFLPGERGGTWIALFRVGDEIHAWHNVCPHQGRSLNWAADRFLFDDDGRLVCPHHGACFELPSGQCVAGPCEGAALKPVTVEVRDGIVWMVNEEPGEKADD